MTRVVMDVSKYKHRHDITVRNYEIDWQGIVHNGNYLLYFEVARVDYFQQIGMEIDERSISGSVRIVVVRNELDFVNTATFGDHLSIHTRISQVKNSSFVCEAVMMNAAKQLIIAKNVAVLVWTDPATSKSTPVPASFRQLVQKFEGADAHIHWPETHV